MDQNNGNQNGPPHDPHLAYQYQQQLQQMQQQQQQHEQAQHVHMMQHQGFFHHPQTQMHTVIHGQQQQLNILQNQLMEVESAKNFKNHELPLARIKKIRRRRSDTDAEAPIIFAKACEMFIVELTVRSWVHTEEAKRRTLQRNDIAAAIAKTDIFDFLIDIVPRDDGKPNKKEMRDVNPTDLAQQQYLYMMHQQQATIQQAQQMQEAQQRQQEDAEGAQENQEESQTEQEQPEPQEMIQNQNDNEQDGQYMEQQPQVPIAPDPNFMSQQAYQNYYMQMQHFQNLTPQVQEMLMQQQSAPHAPGIVDPSSVQMHTMDPQAMEAYQFDPNAYQAFNSHYGHPDAQTYGYEQYEQQQAYDQQQQQQQQYEQQEYEQQEGEQEGEIEE